MLVRALQRELNCSRAILTPGGYQHYWSKMYEHGSINMSHKSFFKSGVIKQKRDEKDLKCPLSLQIFLSDVLLLE